MRRTHRHRTIANAWGMRAEEITAHDEAERLVKDQPFLNAIAELIDDVEGVLLEAFRCIAIRPAARVLLRLRQNPMIERWERRNASV